MNICLVLVFVGGALSTGSPVCNQSAICYKSSNPPQLPRSEERVLIGQARCFAACAKETLKTCQNCSESILQLDNSWVFLNVNRVVSNCSVYRQLKDCQRGCWISSYNAPESLEYCQEQCLIFCSRTCGNLTCDAFYDDSACLIDCVDAEQACEKGCKVGYTIDSNLEGRVPVDPVSPPTLNAVVDSDTAGQYTLNLFSGLLAQNSTTQTVSTSLTELTSFIIKVETNRSAVYTWKAMPNGSRLDLEYLACQVANVSFAVVNKQGISEYSPLSEICVHGGNEYLVGYVLGLLSLTEECGGLYSYTTYFISKDATSFTLSSNTPSDPPIYNCTYTILLRALPQKQATYPVVEQVTPTWVPPDASIECSRELLSNGILTITVMWTLPSVFGLIEAIDHFQIKAVLQDNSSLPAHIVEEIPEVVVVPQVNRTVYSVVLNNLMPRSHVYLEYLINVITFQNEKFHWRKVPSAVQCHVGATTEPPSPVSGNLVVIKQLSFTNQELSLNFSWSPPEVSNGLIDQYQVRVIEPNMAADSSSHSSLAIYMKTIKQTDVTIDAISFAKSLETVCLFLQIRSRNQFFWSNWSEPVPLNRSDQTADCSEVILSSTTATAMNIQTTTSKITELQPSQSPRFTRVNDISNTILFLIAPTLLVAASIAVLLIVIVALFKRRVMRKRVWSTAMETE